MKTQLPNIRLFLAVLIVSAMATSCQKGLRTGDESTANHSLTVRFTPMAGTNRLAFGSTYSNHWGEDYTVSAFKFYISHIKLINSATGVSQDVNKDEYFLVNFADSNATVLQLKAFPNTYDRISLTVGVDSIRNVSGAQTGALDPALGMFWTWNSGYIMAKLEGNSPASTQVNNKFEYHIGGFAGADNIVKPLTIPFPLSQGVALQAGKSSELTIAADVNAWFFNPNDIKISVNPVCMTPGALAKKVFENYSNMFTVTNLVSE